VPRKKVNDVVKIEINQSELVESFGVNGRFEKALNIALGKIGLGAARVYTRGVLNVFRNQGDPPGSWAPLAPFTIQERMNEGFISKKKVSTKSAAAGKNMPILVRTGSFRRAVAGVPTSMVLGGASKMPSGMESIAYEGHYSRIEIKNFQLRVVKGTTDSRYAKLAHGGRSDTGRKVPGRPVLPYGQTIRSATGGPLRSTGFSFSPPEFSPEMEIYLAFLKGDQSMSKVFKVVASNG